MNSFKRAITNIKRQPVKNGLLLVLIFLLGTVLSAAISVRTAIITTEEAVMMRVPALSIIDLDLAAAADSGGEIMGHSVWYHNRPTIQDVSAVASLPHVRTYDFHLDWVILYSRDIEWVVPEIDESRLQGVSFDDLEPGISGQRFWPDVDTEMFIAKGVNNPDITDIEAGLVSLASGRTFHTEEIENGSMVAVISQAYADHNNLYIGATMPLHLAVHNQAEKVREGILNHTELWLEERFLIYHEVLEFEIIGIFNVEYELDYENFEGWDIFGPVGILANLYNRIYIPITVAEDILWTKHEMSLEMFDELRELWRDDSWPDADTELSLQAIFLLYDPRDLGAFTEAADELLPGFWGVVDLSDSFDHIISSMDTILEIADLILLLAAGAAIITLTLTIVLFLRDRRKEIGVYMALGDKKSKILIQFLTEIFLVATVGIALALFTGNIASSNISRNMLEQTLIERTAEVDGFREMNWNLSFFNPAEMPVEEVMEMYDTSLNGRTIMIFISVSAAVIIISTIAPIVQILRLEPKEVLT